MNSRAKLLYCPDCHQKVWTISDKSTGNYSSIPGLRICHECRQLLKSEDCWRTAYHPDPNDDKDQVKASDYSFRIPIKVAYSRWSINIKVPTRLGSIDIKIPSEAKGE